MSALAVYFGVSVTSSLVELEDGSLSFYTFPYAYSSTLFGGLYSQKDFADAVIKAVAKRVGSKPEDFAILVAGVVDAPQVSFEPKLSLSLSQVLAHVSAFSPIFVDNCELDLSDTDAYCENLAIYPQIKAVDITDRMDLDRRVVQRRRTTSVGTPQVFTGDRFVANSSNRDLTYLLMLELLKAPDVYSLCLDNKNATVLLTLLELFKNTSLDSLLMEHISSVGTLVKSAGAVECYIDSEVGKPQLFDVKENSLFVVPMANLGTNRFHIKSAKLGSVEGKISGHTSNMDLIFDTRTTDLPIYDDIRMLSAGLKIFGGTI
jgi:hypothetical protein